MSKARESLELISLVVLMLVITGCAVKEDKSRGPKNVNLRFAGGAFKLYDEFRRQQAVEFEKKHPGVKVKYEPVPGEFNAKILTQIAGGVAPDVILTFGPMALVDFVKGGALLPIDPYIKDDSDFDISLIYPESVDEYTYKDKIYALPANLGTNALYYNKKLFNEAGLSYPDGNWDWGQVLNAAQRLTKKDISGKISHFGIVISYLESWFGFVKQYGGELWNKERTECIIDSPEAREATEFLKDLFKKYHVSPTPTEIANEMGVGGSIEVFGMGRAAMMYGGRWITSVLIHQKDLDWTVSPLPKYKGKRLGVTGGLGWAISSQTKYPQLAYELVKHLSSPEGIRFMIDMGDSMPIHRTSEETEYFLQSCNRPREENQIYIDAMKSTFSMKDFVNPNLIISTTEQRSIINTELERAFIDEISIGEALANIEKKLNAAIKKK
ncbi:MAG: sugar ABC transporter substrate-binding protein [Planctomycetes bacterium]|nr:sugar ABC transporter substrate-binding protein [Planctomycetota bacterium]